MGIRSHLVNSLCSTNRLHLRLAQSFEVGSKWLGSANPPHSQVRVYKDFVKMTLSTIDKPPETDLSNFYRNFEKILFGVKYEAIYFLSVHTPESLLKPSKAINELTVGMNSVQ